MYSVSYSICNLCVYFFIGWNNTWLLLNLMRMQQQNLNVLSEGDWLILLCKAIWTASLYEIWYNILITLPCLGHWFMSSDTLMLSYFEFNQIPVSTM